MPQHIATWNPTTQLWESEDIDLFSEQAAPWSEPWPTSGIAVDGRLYPLPASAPPTAGNECSSSPVLPTPRRTDFQGKDSVGEWTRHSPSLDAVQYHFGQMLPTPRATDGTKGRPESARIVGGSDAAVSGDEPGVALLPTPRTSDTNGAGHHGDGGMDLRTTVTLLPTPAAQDGNGGGRYSSEGHQTTLPGEARLLCTPSASDGAGGKTSRSGGRIDEPLLGGQAREMESSWGKYEPAIRRWEQVLGRSAPPPTEPNKNGNPRLAAEFSSWLMGWPAGWVTDPVIGISRNDQLRIVGNGVCPQQCAAAVRYLLSVVPA